jgi:hypothetical protein
MTILEKVLLVAGSVMFLGALYLRSGLPFFAREYGRTQSPAIMSVNQQMEVLRSASKFHFPQEESDQPIAKKVVPSNILDWIPSGIMEEKISLTQFKDGHMGYTIQFEAENIGPILKELDVLGLKHSDWIKVSSVSAEDAAIYEVQNAHTMIQIWGRKPAGATKVQFLMKTVDK